MSRNLPTTIVPVTKHAESSRPKRSSAARTTRWFPSAVVRLASVTGSTAAPSAVEFVAELRQRCLGADHRPTIRRTLQNEVVSPTCQGASQRRSDVAGGHRDERNWTRGSHPRILARPSSERRRVRASTPTTRRRVGRRLAGEGSGEGERNRQQEDHGEIAVVSAMIPPTCGADDLGDAECERRRRIARAERLRGGVSDDIAGGHRCQTTEHQADADRAHGHHGDDTGHDPGQCRCKDAETDGRDAMRSPKRSAAMPSNTPPAMVPIPTSVNIVDARPSEYPESSSRRDVRNDTASR